jgi:hypothetical protein
MRANWVVIPDRIEREGGREEGGGEGGGRGWETDRIIEKRVTTSLLKKGNFPKRNIQRQTPAAHRSDMYAE